MATGAAPTYCIGIDADERTNTDDAELLYFQSVLLVFAHCHSNFENVRTVYLTDHFPPESVPLQIIQIIMRNDIYSMVFGTAQTRHPLLSKDPSH